MPDENDGNSVETASRRFSTMLQLKNYNRLTKLAQSMPDIYGHWSYDKAIERLFDDSSILTLIALMNSRADHLESRIVNLEGKKDSAAKTVKCLGGIVVGGEDNERIE